MIREIEELSAKEEDYLIESGMEDLFIKRILEEIKKTDEIKNASDKLIHLHKFKFLFRR